MLRLHFLLGSLLLAPAPLGADDWPQWMGPQRDGLWRESGLLDAFPERGAKVLWRLPAGPGYAGPAVASGRVFFLEREARPTPDTSKGILGIERLRCLDAATGRAMWQREWDAAYSIDYSCGPRATPTVHDGLVYALGAEGHLACVRADDGGLVWQRDLKRDFRCSAPTWGFAGHPLVYQELLLCLVGGTGSTCVALDRKSGKEVWRALSSKQAGYCPPTLIDNHGKPEIILWHGEAINALDPATGKVHWTMPRDTLYGVSMAMPRQVGTDLLISCFWWGSKMLRLKADHSLPEVVWETERESDRRTTHLNALMCTPLVHAGHIYGVCSYGQLRCLDWATGTRKWETFAATTGAGEDLYGHAFLTRLAGQGEPGNRFIIFNEKGELILARLTPEKYHLISRSKIVEPDCPDLTQRRVVWMHPAYADKKAFVKNNREIVCVDLAR
jgi:outer membrane protein assembly factor BamB